MRNSSPPTATGRLARDICRLELDQLDPLIISTLKTCLLYGLTMAAAGAQHTHEAEPLERLFGQSGTAQALLSGHSFQAMDAAFLNAQLMCARGQNDTFSEAFSHPGCVIIPALLAVAQDYGSSGKELLVAMTAGYETLARCAVDTAPAAVARHFRASPVFGVIAVAAATCRLLRLDAERTAHALGLATQFAGGTMQCWTEGTPEWRIQIGQTSRAGVFSALLAMSGQKAASQSLEGPQGFYAAFCGTARAPKEQWLWHTPKVVFKPMPGCLINQPAVYLLMQIQRIHAIRSSDIARVKVELSPRNAGYPGIANYGPFDTPAGAIMSCPFMIEVMLRQGAIQTADFRTGHDNPDINASSRRVHVSSSPEVTDWGCRLTLETHDGRTLTQQMQDLETFCFSWAECDALLEQVAKEWPLENAAKRYQQLRKQVSHLEGAATVNPLIAPLVASSAPT